MTPCTSKGGAIPITTEALRFTLTDQQRFEFIVADAKQWQRAVKASLAEA